MKMTKDIYKSALVEVIYNRTKKSTLIAYLLGGLLGGLGAHWFYLRQNDLGVMSLILLMSTFIVFEMIYIHLAYTFVAVVWTYFMVEKVNKEIHIETELLYGEKG